MFNTPLRYSRPARTAAGPGGSSETLAADPLTLWADPVVQDGKQLLIVHADEDVRLGDVIEVPHELFL